MRANIERYRLLGDTILLQREEVQQFFLMAIETCKRDMDNYQGSDEQPERHYGEKVDIDDLLSGAGNGVFDWEDIEWNELGEISVP